MSNRVTKEPGVFGLKSLRAVTTSMRPKHWIKNILLFGGLVFTDSIFDLSAIVASLRAFFLFCFAASTVYLLNDIRDVDKDRLHPQKRHRPFAAGQVSANTMILSTALLANLVLFESFRVSKSFGMLVTLYFAINVLYTIFLKTLPVIDVMSISSGFVIRVVAGVIAVGLAPSPWVVLCTMTLALFVGFGKRRHELHELSGRAVDHRRSLSEYSPEFLDMIMGVSAASAIVTYALFTVSDAIVVRTNTRLLIFTTPMVIYGIFRYMLLIMQHNEGGDPARLFAKDRPMLINAILWVTATAFIVNAPPNWLPWWAVETDVQTQVEEEDNNAEPTQDDSSLSSNPAADNK